jgi:hypothetical protein
MEWRRRTISMKSEPLVKAEYDRGNLTSYV